jgi:hypothetical protein
MATNLSRGPLPSGASTFRGRLSPFHWLIAEPFTELTDTPYKARP